MRSIEEQAIEAQRNIHPLFETLNESTGKPVSVYDQDDMIDMFEQGANYVLECIEEATNICFDEELRNVIKQLKR